MSIVPLDYSVKCESYYRYDRVVDCIPVASLVKAFVQACHKLFLVISSPRYSIPTCTPYELLVREKSWAGMLVASLPLFGNLFHYCFGDDFDSRIVRDAVEVALLQRKRGEVDLDRKEREGSIDRYEFNIGYVPQKRSDVEDLRSKGFIEETDLKALFNEYKPLFQRNRISFSCEVEKKRQADTWYTLLPELPEGEKDAGLLYNFLCLLLGGATPFPESQAAKEDVKEGGRMLHIVLKKIFLEKDKRTRYEELERLLYSCTGCQIALLLDLHEMVYKEGSNSVVGYFQSLFSAYMQAIAEKMVMRVFGDDFERQKNQAKSEEEKYKDKAHVMGAMRLILFEGGARNYPGGGILNKTVNREYVLDQFKANNRDINSERDLFLFFSREVQRHLPEFIQDSIEHLRSPDKETLAAEDKPLWFLSYEKKIKFLKLWKGKWFFDWLKSNNEDRKGHTCFFSQKKLINGYYNTADLDLLLNDTDMNYLTHTVPFPSRIEMLRVFENIGFIKKKEGALSIYDFRDFLVSRR